MKIILLFLFIFVCRAFSLSDTISTNIVAPGVIHTQYTLPGPFTLDVLEVDITNPLLTFETYKPAGGLTKTTVQAAANDNAGHRVIGAINAGFFSFETGWPVHNQVANGKPVLGISQARSSFVFTENRKVFIERFNFSGKIFANNGSSLTINETNTTRGSEKTVLFSSYKGMTTGTDANGMEAVLEIVSQPLVMNDTLQVVVKQKASGNSTIPTDGFVISGGTGIPATFMTNNFSVGDTVKLFLTFNPIAPASVKRLTQLISGYGHLIKDGVTYPTLGDYDLSGSSFNNTRHPRTFVGINDDTTKVYLCTVDGRQSTSLGMTFTEMANFLVTLGVKDAFNLDGGGSTTMVVRSEIVNSPSDPGGERSVANTLQVISTAPVGTLHYLNLLENKADVFQGNTFQFHTEGKDEFYNPLSLPVGTVWNCDTAIGAIDTNGLFAAKNTNDSGWVRVKYNSISDSVRVFVRVIKELRIYPTSLVMTPGEQITLAIYGIDSGNNNLPIQGTQVIPKIIGQGINFSPSDKVLTATGFNKGTFQLSLDTVKLQLNYDFSGADTTIIAEKFNDQFLWKQDITGTDPDNVFFGLSPDTVFSAPNSFRVFYSFPRTDVATAILKTSLPLASRPDSIYVKVFGNGGGHTLKLIFNDKNGDQFYIISPTIVNWNGVWQNVGSKMVNAKPVSTGTLDFPITLSEIQILLGENNPVGSKAVGTIFIDDISVHYPNRAVSPSVLYDFNSGITGWLQPYGVGSGQTYGIMNTSKLEYSTEHPYEGSGSGKWTFIDSVSSNNWNIRISRTTSAELAYMLRGSYIGAWVWANGKLGITMRTVIRGGATGLCQGPAFPVNHIGWKLIGVRLDESQFTTYITSGKIVDTGNKFNGFHVEANNADINGKTVILYVDKMVTSALTVPSGFLDFGATWDSSGNQVKISWGVNSEISINRYQIERNSNGISFSEIGTVSAKGNSDTTVRYSYYDNIGNLTSAKYRIRQITNDGGQETTPIINFNLTNMNGDYFSPLNFVLQQNYPNPFNPITTIQFQIATAAHTRLKIYDILGREISTLLDQDINAGPHKFRWDSSKISSGVYFYRLSSGNFVDTKKMIVAK
ncbi:MAG: phosphodiester glycosidase family protein [Bacteroidota bacterium]|nr:phosphodiester glycosidase family protein [Bacteroidota bacterium]